jgi:hypothetical protein
MSAAKSLRDSGTEWNPERALVSARHSTRLKRHTLAGAKPIIVFA